eukprot:scaffold60373_cov29-Prasinocladus_malaysianus.AAC.4
MPGTKPEVSTLAHFSSIQTNYKIGMRRLAYTTWNVQQNLDAFCSIQPLLVHDQSQNTPNDQALRSVCTPARSKYSELMSCTGSVRLGPV